MLVTQNLNDKLNEPGGLFSSDRARQIGIQNLQPFLTSDIFKAHSLTFDEKRKLILQRL